MDFFRDRSTIALICAIIALVWMIFCGSAIGDVVSGVGADDTAAQLGTMIGMAMLAPYFIVGWLATFFNWLGYFMNKSGFVLTAAILYCVALFLAISYGFGLIPCIILGFIGYVRIKTYYQF